MKSHIVQFAFSNFLNNQTSVGIDSNQKSRRGQIENILFVSFKHLISNTLKQEGLVVDASPVNDAQANSAINSEPEILNFRDRIAQGSQVIPSLALTPNGALHDLHSEVFCALYFNSTVSSGNADLEQSLLSAARQAAKACASNLAPGNACPRAAKLVQKTIYCRGLVLHLGFTAGLHHASGSNAALPRAFSQTNKMPAKARMEKLVPGKLRTRQDLLKEDMHDLFASATARLKRELKNRKNNTVLDFDFYSPKRPLSNPSVTGDLVETMRSLVSLRIVPNDEVSLIPTRHFAKKNRQARRSRLRAVPTLCEQLSRMEHKAIGRLWRQLNSERGNSSIGNGIASFFDSITLRDCTVYVSAMASIKLESR
jgi:hypothetical protein